MKNKKNLILSIGGVLGMMGIVLIPLIVNMGKAQATKDYNYEVVEKSNDANLYPGQKVILWVKIKNTGNKTWYNDSSKGDAVYLNVQNAGNSSPFYTAGNWVSPLVVHRADQETTAPGGTTSYGFYATAPENIISGSYTIKTLPVVDNYGSMIDRNISWNINIKTIDHEDIYAAEVTGPKEIVIGLDEFDNCDASMQKKDNNLDVCNTDRTKKVTFKVKNTGNATWYNPSIDKSAPKINLATYNPKDRISAIYNTTWLSENRPINIITSDLVAPGNEAEFTFVINVPKTIPAGQDAIRETFWLVAENKTWFANTGLMDVWIVKNVPVKPIPPVVLPDEEENNSENIDIDEDKTEENINVDEDNSEDNINIDEDSEDDVNVDEDNEEEIDVDTDNQEDEIDINEEVEDEVNINKSSRN